MGELATQKAISVNCIGWHHHAYVHPRLTFYPSEHSNNPRMVLQTMHLIEGFIQQGSSDSWRQHVGCYCLDNPLLIVGVCAALMFRTNGMSQAHGCARAMAAPLLHLCRVDGFGLLLYGASSTGKTAALYPASSVWGKSNQLRHSWRATASGLEGTALAHNDALLASAGLLATQAKVLDWPAQSVEAACLSQLNQWILARGGVAANEDQQAIRQVRSFIEQHGESRFTLHRRPKPRPRC